MKAKEHQLLRREAELSRLEKEIRKREIELRKNDRALAIRETVLIEKERRYKGKYNSSHFTYSGRLVAVRYPCFTILLQITEELVTVHMKS